MIEIDYSTLGAKADIVVDAALYKIERIKEESKAQMHTIDNLLLAIKFDKENR